MARIYAPRADEAFVRSEGNGDISRDEIKLKTSATVYAVGTPVIAEQTAGVPSGLFIRVTEAILEDDVNYESKTVSLVLRRTDATAGNTDTSGFSRDGIVDPAGIELPANVTIADLIPHFAAQGVIIR